jgi:decaprenylphospho-beta-D-ribofuranose 2-oxidase
VSSLLSGWGRTAPTRAEVVRPESAEAVAAALADGRPVIARGLGRAYGDAAQNAGGLVIDATGLDAVHAFDTERGVIDAGAGLGLEALIALALPHGWFVPVTPGTRHITLGGALAADVHGKNHHVDGAFSRHVEAFELAVPGGELREITPADPLFAATAGGMGLTGVVTRMRLRLSPVTSAHMRVTTTRAGDLDALMASMRERDAGFRYSVAWIDCLKRGAAMGRGVLLRGEHATADELPPRLRRKPLAYSPRPVLGVPGVVPSGLLNIAVARAFNEAYFRRAPAQERIGLEPIGPYFHPLDAVAAWNRLYGPRGFVQYQAVVPDAEGEAVRALVERVSGAGMSSFLAVLKRFGEGTGMLSFPMAGWTLALDIPVGASDLARRLDELDDIVVAAGGRVYLAKDARVRPELLPAMYPDLERWREVRRSADPEGLMRSDLARRLGLVCG